MNIEYIDHFFNPLLARVDPILQLSVFIAIVFQTLFSVGRNGASALMAMLQYLVQLTFMRSNANLSARDQKVLSDFPSDPRSFKDSLDLEADATIYAVCPNDKCQTTYAAKYKDGSPVAIYPSRCKARHMGRRCKEQLLRPRVVAERTIYMPIKPFVYFNPLTWVGRLLSRPGIEADADKSWDRSKTQAGTMRDIFDGDILRKFKGPDGAHFSMGNGEGRYVFSLSVDFFNPLSNKQAGKKVSVGLITLVCLNLPPDIRYKPENMFLAGVIPGPHELPLSAISHFLKPLVDDFLKFWDPGVHYSRTDGHPDGRLVRCAIVCIVCDLPAAQKTAGFALSAHTHFCSICHCDLKTHGYANLDYTSWCRRTNQDCRRTAKQFRRAGSSPAADRIVASTGVRWSQLLRLPYFDPSRFVVVDAMHNLFLGLIREHYDAILGIRVPKAEEEPVVFNVNISDSWKQMSKRECASMKRVIRWLQHPMCQDLWTEAGMSKWQKRFSSQNSSILELVALEVGCMPITTDIRKKKKPSRADYSRGILRWVGLFHSCFVVLSAHNRFSECLKLKLSMIWRDIRHQAPCVVMFLR